MERSHVFRDFDRACGRRAKIRCPSSACRTAGRSFRVYPNRHFRLCSAPYPAEGAYFVTREFVEQEQQDILATLQRTEASFRAAAGEKGSKLEWLEWRSAIDLPEIFVGSEARSADLVILGRAPRPMDISR